jgi:NAD(P)-dependent dehydrogenase (short-subunit alcohol dehydrogenase family)
MPTLGVLLVRSPKGSAISLSYIYHNNKHLCKSEQLVEQIRFNAQDVELFREASHDVNPLHTSAAYARRTSYGEPVVYGILGTLAALSLLPERPGRVISEVALTFLGPIFQGIDYASKVTAKGENKAKVVLEDAGRSVLSASLTFVPGTDEGELAPSARPRETPTAWTLEDLRPGLEANGRYSPEPAALAALIARWRLAGKGFGAAHVSALLWASYLVGMELPGERATFTRLQVSFDGAAAQAPLDYQARVAEEIDERFDLLQIEAGLWQGGSKFAKSGIWSIVRRDPPEFSPATLLTRLAPSEALRGKTGLVTGGARGLGAAFVAALASQGCHVLLNYHSSRGEAEALRDSLADATGQVTLVQGDASDTAWCRSMRDRVIEGQGGLDILVCNASPPIRPLGLTPDSLDRVADFLGRSFGLVAGPLAAGYELIASRSGWCVVVSSEYARTAPAEFPHYVAAKCAAEGLARSVAARFPKANLLLVRPPRLLTDQTNVASAREGALPVEAVAAAVVARICDPRPSAGAELLEEFAPMA